MTVSHVRTRTPTSSAIAVAMVLVLVTNMVTADETLRRLPPVYSSPVPVEGLLQPVASEIHPHAPASEFAVAVPSLVSAAVNSLQANQSSDAQSWMSGYQARINSNLAEGAWRGKMEHRLPLAYSPWWDAQVRRPFYSESSSLRVNISGLNEGALRHSSYVLIITAAPDIRQTELIRQEAAFDWRTFLETTYSDINEPIGNTLTTGTNATRYEDRNWSLNGGNRQRNALGGEVELSQRFGTEGNNSRFLLPNPQGTTQLELQYTQPLLKNSGRAYNESQIVLAQIQYNQSSDAVVEELESHLVKVTESYWELYRARAEFLQRHKLLASAEHILTNLTARRGVDAVERQVLRARTAVAKRRTEIIRNATQIRNWESQLRLLVNDPLLLEAGGREFTPDDAPLLELVPLDMSESLHTALINRPSISLAIREVRSAAVDLGVAQKDILPKLDLVASTYVQGLAPNADPGQAFANQFTQGNPSYSVGLQFEIPIGNRAANAQARRRQLELTRAMNRFRLTVEESLTAVEVAVREVETSYLEMVAKFHALEAATKEAQYLEDRWKVLPGVEDSAALLLENLLDAQERVADEESSMVRSQVNYAMAMVRLKSEMGTLLRVRRNPSPLDDGPYSAEQTTHVGRR